MVKAGKMICQMMVNANWMRASRTGSRSTRRPPQGQWQPAIGVCGYRVSRSFCRGCRGRRPCAPLGNLFFEPEAVVLLGPVQVDTARTHRLERALHAQGSDVDVTDDERDEQDRNDAVNPLGDLHAKDVGHVEWK